MHAIDILRSGNHKIQGAVGSLAGAEGIHRERGIGHAKGIVGKIREQVGLGAKNAVRHFTCQATHFEGAGVSVLDVVVASVGLVGNADGVGSASLKVQSCRIRNSGISGERVAVWRVVQLDLQVALRGHRGQCRQCSRGNDLALAGRRIAVLQSGGPPYRDSIVHVQLGSRELHNLNRNFGVQRGGVVDEGSVELEAADVKVGRSQGIQKSCAVHTYFVQIHKGRLRIEEGGSVDVIVDADLDGVVLSARQIHE